MNRPPRLASRVLLIGWDAADWQMARPLIDAGRMPHLARMIEQGVSGNLATLRPILSPMLWSSVATGHTADVHGVHGFTEAVPDRSGVRPISSRSRQCKALWNILTQSGLKSNVVGWYATHPAEPIDGVMVSNLFEQPKGPIHEHWEVPDGAVHPAEFTDELKALRVHPAEIDASVVASFVPRIREAFEKLPKKIAHLRSLMSQTASIHAIATHLIENTQWDLTAVYYEGIDRFGHEFMHLHPPKLGAVDAEEYELFQHVMKGCYLFHDMMLGRLLELAGDDTTVMLVSDHGYYNDHLRPDLTLGEKDPTRWHRPMGVVAMHGAAVKSNETLYGATLLDIAPTVLRLLGLPVGADMPGRPWGEAFIEPLTPARILSWESVDGECGRLGEDVAEDPATARAMLQQLVDLGYVQAPGEDIERTVRQTEISNQLNLVQSLHQANRYEESLALLQDLNPGPEDELSVRTQMAACLTGLDRLNEAEAELDALDTLLDETQRAGLELMRASLMLKRGQPDEALARFEAAVKKQPHSVELNLRIGLIHHRAGDHELASSYLHRVLGLDPDNHTAMHALSEIAFDRRDFDAAVDFELDALARLYFHPKGHFHLARALVAAGDLERACDALGVATLQAKHYPAAHQLYAQTLERLGRPEEAHQQQHLADQAEIRLSRQTIAAPAGAAT